jgi:hypothetical protein
LIENAPDGVDDGMGAPISRHDDRDVYQNSHRLVSAVRVGAFSTHDSKDIAGAIRCAGGLSMRSWRSVYSRKTFDGRHSNERNSRVCCERLAVGRIERVKMRLRSVDAPGQCQAKELPLDPVLF